ncbi:DUF6188 family protein [Streptomyces justiciae]|uniref:DUF6188 family protein n=1 Tax=Streptomyces justiciae TaxID=2780140 RepID=UPI00187F3C13|nr:DUF6188 family protein [Streptomyces justiciae]MBE8477498.1 hypothetical protein [Streptomyces justiciae]MCW8382437.1 DUF6188 family protein [Streptomyces justiciae]
MNLNLRGQAVTRVCFDAALTVLTSGDCEIRIETESVLRVSNEDHVSFHPESPDAVSSYLVRLARDVIVEAEVGRCGDLMIEFESGMKLTVRPDEEYEAWGLVGPEGRRVTCLPGGDIAVWSGE